MEAPLEGWVTQQHLLIKAAAPGSSPWAGDGVGPRRLWAWTPLPRPGRLVMHPPRLGHPPLPGPAFLEYSQATFSHTHTHTHPLPTANTSPQGLSFRWYSCGSIIEQSNSIIKNEVTPNQSRCFDSSPFHYLFSTSGQNYFLEIPIR